MTNLSISFAAERVKIWGLTLSPSIYGSSVGARTWHLITVISPKYI